LPKETLVGFLKKWNLSNILWNNLKPRKLFLLG